MDDISNISDVMELAFELIEIESITNNEALMGQTLEKWLQSRGWIVKRQIYSKSPLRFNILSYPNTIKNPSTEIEILFNTHIDTVPPFFGASYSKNNTGKDILCGRS
eukprot:738095_1